MYILYATANDKKNYYNDIINLTRIAKVRSGIHSINLLIAISKVKPCTLTDHIFTKYIRYLFSKIPTIKLNNIIFKENEGRDFSSYNILLQNIKDSAQPEEYIFFLNRSSCGPFKASWYKSFIEQYEKYENICLCGSTINLSGHPKIGNNSQHPHVQTYNFLTQTKYMALLNFNFPALTETDRLQLIQKGEIGLSKYFLDLGYGITCMEWPDVAIFHSEPIPEWLPRNDIKKMVTKSHAFYHRRNKKHRVFWYFDIFMIDFLFFNLSNRIFHFIVPYQSNIVKKS